MSRLERTEKGMEAVPSPHHIPVTSECAGREPSEVVSIFIKKFLKILRNRINAATKIMKKVKCSI